MCGVVGGEVGGVVGHGGQFTAASQLVLCVARDVVCACSSLLSTYVFVICSNYAKM